MDVQSQVTQGARKWPDTEPPSPKRERPESKSTPESENSHIPRHSRTSRPLTLGPQRNPSAADSVECCCSHARGLNEDPPRLLRPLLKAPPFSVEYRLPSEAEARLKEALSRCARSKFDSRRLASESPNKPVLLVVGIFEGPDSIPNECCIYVKHHRWIFWQLWLNIVWLRGFRYMFTLKDVMRFRLYSVKPSRVHMIPCLL